MERAQGHAVDGRQTQPGTGVRVCLPREPWHTALLPLLSPGALAPASPLPHVPMVLPALRPGSGSFVGHGEKLGFHAFVKRVSDLIASLLS